MLLRIVRLMHNSVPPREQAPRLPLRGPGRAEARSRVEQPPELTHDLPRRPGRRPRRRRGRGGHADPLPQGGGVRLLDCDRVQRTSHRARDVERLRTPMQQITDFMLKHAGIKATSDVVPLEAISGATG